MIPTPAAIALLGGPICGSDPLSRQIAALLKKKIGALGHRACQADKPTKPKRFARPVAKAKAKALIPLADAAIDTRVAKHKLTVTCGATLKTFLANLAQVVPTSPGT